MYLVTPASEDHVMSEGGYVQVLSQTVRRLPKGRHYIYRENMAISIEDWALDQYTCSNA